MAWETVVGFVIVVAIIAFIVYKNRTSAKRWVDKQKSSIDKRRPK